MKYVVDEKVLVELIEAKARLELLTERMSMKDFGKYVKIMGLGCKEEGFSCMNDMARAQIASFTLGYVDDKIKE